jgi:predicted TPR repeat methyltransferase
MERVEWTTEASDTADLRQRYDAWAEAYDVDLLDGEGYGAVVDRVGTIMRHHVPLDARILELGCGTGLVGKALQQLGYTRLNGVDLSLKMLDKSRQTKAYQALQVADLNAGIPAEDASCDAVLAVGTLTYLKPQILIEVARTLAPGGQFVFTFQPAVHAANGFQAIQDQLLADGQIISVQVSEPFAPLPKSLPEVRFRVSVLQKPVWD